MPAFHLGVLTLFLRQVGFHFPAKRFNNVRRRFRLKVPALQSVPAKRIVPLIVAVALFMENMDSTVIATSLPAIAADIGTSPLTLKLAVTSYLLSLAVFIPVSGWTADRFGALTVFRAAITVFMLGSIGCALSGTLTQFVAARILEGMGGAMMTPVARLILVRSVDRRELINAMVWVTLPALVGPLIGPALGGFITTFISWHWIFLINIPIGVAGIVLATIFIEDVKAEAPDPFDPVGSVLAGLGIGGLVFGGSLLGLNFLPTGVVLVLIAAGAVATYAYVLHARRTPAPVLDLSLLKIPTMRAAVVGGFIYRCGIGAMPFLLPLLLQLGFGLTPFQSGLITLSNVVGAMGMKTVVPIILRRFGFRQVLVVNALISALFVAACATFTPGVPFAWIVGVLVIGGFFRSLEFTSLNTIAYADVDNRRMSRATSLVAVAQQVSISIGVAIGALVVDLTLLARGRTTITAADFQPAYIAIAMISACAFFFFVRLPTDAGAELARRTPTPPAGPTEATDQKLS
jgi:EmrB/QacA subfamily drug resistance transporter